MLPCQELLTRRDELLNVAVTLYQWLDHIRVPEEGGGQDGGAHQETALPRLKGSHAQRLPGEVGPVGRDGAPPSFLYTIPTFQNPSGRSLSTERRRRIVEIIVAHRLAVLEDDPYGLVRYEGVAQPRLHDLEGGELVSYTSSFSKTVAPGLRTGYFVLPADTAASFEERAVSTYISPPFLAQAAVGEFIARGHFEPNLVRVCGELRARRDAMTTTLERTFPPGSSWSRPQGGYFVWVELPDDVTTAELMARAESAGVAFVRGEDFFPRGSGLGRSSARLAFSYESLARIVEGVERLAALVIASTGSMVAPRA